MDYMIPATRHFLKLPQNKYLFFRTPDGTRTPTLANISTSHLTSLAALNTTMPNSSANAFPPYISNLGDGCFPLWDAIPQSKYPDKVVGTRLLSLAKLSWMKLKCQFIPRWRRPNHACPFDRRPGTVYWNKKVEPEHDT